jgi:hypothetical protein
MRIAQALIALLTSALLASCGGGGTPSSEGISARLLAAPHSYADASLCESSAPGYAIVEGRCQQLFDRLRPPTPVSQAIASAPQNAGSAPKPQMKSLVNVSTNDFYAWAQSAYYSLFPGTYIEDSAYLPGYGTFLYRYYFATETYLGILNGYVYVYGPVTGWTVYPVGALNDYSCAIYGCAPARSFISWTNSVNGEVVKDAGNENFAFYSDSACLYSYARQQETTNFCLYQGSAQGSFAGVAVRVILATNSTGTGCLAVLADPYGRQVDIYTDPYGIQTVSVLNTYWYTSGCG